MPVDDDITTTRWCAEDAAKAAGVRVGTLRNWVYRKHLKPAVDEHGRPLLDEQGRVTYWALDVARAERKTRQRARRFSIRAA